MQSPGPGEKQLCVTGKAGDQLVGKQLCRKRSKAHGGQQVCQQCALVAKKAESIVSCMRGSIISSRGR